MPTRTRAKAQTTEGMYLRYGMKHGMKPEDVKAAFEGFLALAAAQTKKYGLFTIVGMLKLKLRVKPATPARSGENPFTKEPCLFKAKPASKTLTIKTLKKYKRVFEDLDRAEALSDAEWEACFGSDSSNETSD